MDHSRTIILINLNLLLNFLQRRKKEAISSLKPNYDKEVYGPSFLTETVKPSVKTRKGDPMTREFEVERTIEILRKVVYTKRTIDRK